MLESLSLDGRTVVITGGGTGLGLAISKHIVEGLGGSVTVTSQQGEGTTVRLTMPRDATSAAHSASSSPVEAAK